MSLTVGTKVQVTRQSNITLRGELGIISEIDGSTYVVQTENHGERYFGAENHGERYFGAENHGERYFGAEELAEVAEDYTTWNGYKLLNVLEREISNGGSREVIMDLQNEIYRRMLAN